MGTAEHQRHIFAAAGNVGEFQFLSINSRHGDVGSRFPNGNSGDLFVGASERAKQHHDDACVEEGFHLRSSVARKESLNVTKTLFCRSVDFVKHDDKDVTRSKTTHRPLGTAWLAGEISGDRQHTRAALSHPTIDLVFHLRNFSVNAFENLDLLHCDFAAERMRRSAELLTSQDYNARKRGRVYRLIDSGSRLGPSAIGRSGMNGFGFGSHNCRRISSMVASPPPISSNMTFTSWSLTVWR